MADLTHDASYLVYFVPTLSTPATPSTAAIVAGTQLDTRMTPSGLDRGAGNDTVDTSKLNSTYTTAAVGRRNFNPTITIVRGDATGEVAVETALAFKATGFLVIRDNKPSGTALASGDKVDVFPVQIGVQQKAAPAANELQTITYNLTMTADAYLNVATTA